MEHNSTALAVLDRAVEITGRTPGLFLGEYDRLEARWLIARGAENPVQVVNVTFNLQVEVYENSSDTDTRELHGSVTGNITEVYVYDRELGEITVNTTLDLESEGAANALAAIVNDAVGSFI